MILRHLLKNLDKNEGDGGSNPAPSGSQAAPDTSTPIVPPSVAVADKPKSNVTPKTGGALEPRKPSEAELKVEFQADPEILGEEVVPVKPAEAKKTEKVEVKEEPKVESKVEPKVEQKPLSTVIMPPGGQPKARDYSGFSDAEQKVLKAMSNEAFDYVSAQLKEKRELEKLKGAEYMQHPQAFVLDPQFQKLQEDAQYFNQEAKHWEQQLIAIEAGQDWAPIIGWNQDGSPKLGPVQKATTEAKIRVGQAMNQCMGLAQNTNTQIQQFAGNYQQRVKADNDAIQGELAKRFGWVADPKVLDATIDVPGVGVKSIKDIRSDFISVFPPYLQNTKGVDIAAHCWAALQCVNAQNRELQNGKHVAEIKAEEVTRAEPTSTLKPAAAGKAINGVKEFSMEGVEDLGIR